MMLLINQNRYCLWAISFSPVKRFGILVVSLFLILVVWFLVVKLPLSWYKNSLNRLIEIYEKECIEYKLLQQHKTDLEVEYKKSCQVDSYDVNHLSSSMHDIFTISSLAEKSGLVIESCAVERQTEKKKPIIYFSGQGNFYTVFSFLEQLASDTISFRYDELSIEKNKDTLVVGGIFTSA